MTKGKRDKNKEQHREEYLEGKLLKAHRDYYNGDECEFTDKEYESLKRRYLSLCTQNASTPNPDIVERVGAAVDTSVDKVAHTSPMLSLDNVFSEDELRDWVLKCRETLGKDSHFSVEPKYDGLAVEAVYIAGKLTRLSTRGDGVTGESVLYNAGTVDGLPTFLHRKARDLPRVVTIRGEVVMTAKDMKEENHLRVQQGSRPYSNTRNAAAGALRRSNSESPLTFYPYEMSPPVGDSYTDTIKETYELLGLGARYVDMYLPTIGEYSRDLDVSRPLEDDATVPLDGYVIKVTPLVDQISLGKTTRVPRWAIALKFEEIEETAEVLSVIWQVGRTGAISPVARLTPTPVSGVTVTRATLANLHVLKTKGIMVGAIVGLQRAGGVVPEITRVIDYPEDAAEVVIPTVCPSCGGGVSTLPSADGKVEKMHLVCSTGIACPARATGELLKLTSRPVLNVLGIGKVAADKLTGAPWWVDAYSIFTCDLGKLTERGIGHADAVKILANLEKATNTDLAKFILALGIDHVGKSLSPKVAEHFQNLEEFTHATVSDLLEVSDLGEEIAESIVAFFKSDFGKRRLDGLITAGLSYGFKGIVRATDTPLYGKSVCITGKFYKNREEIADDLKKMGATVTSNVSAKTWGIVLGEKPSAAKVAKANKLSTVSFTFGPPEGHDGMWDTVKLMG